MSNISRDLESLGKSNGKKWSQSFKNTNKGCKIAAHFFVVVANLGLINHKSLRQSSQDFYGIGATIRID